MKNAVTLIFIILALSGCLTVKDVDESFKVRDLIVKYYNMHSEWPESKSDLIDFSKRENLSYNRRYSLKFSTIENNMLKVEFSKGLFGHSGSFTLSPESKVYGTYPSKWSFPKDPKDKSQPIDADNPDNPPVNSKNQLDD